MKRDCEKIDNILKDLFDAGAIWGSMASDRRYGRARAIQAAGRQLDDILDIEWDNDGNIATIRGLEVVS